MSSRIAMLVLTALLAVVAANGQISASATSGSTIVSGTIHIPQQPFAPRAVTGAPYSAEEVIDTVQTLGDGTHITRTNAPTKMYRDSAGRTRTERPAFQGALLAMQNPSDSPTIVEIVDPVAQAKYTLDAQSKVAHKQALASPPAPPVRGTAVTASQAAAAARSEDPARPHNSFERLGSQRIEGVAAEGTRRTTTYPIGALGNDRPIVTTSETWISTELQVVVLSRVSDPRSGDRTQKLVNVSMSERDPNLFQPPADYTVVEEKGDFTIRWGSARGQ